MPQRLAISTLLISFALMVGAACQRSGSPVAPAASGSSEWTIAPQVDGDQLVTAAVWDLQIDPSSLNASLTAARSATAQPPQALRYDLDIGNFLTPQTLQIAGVRLGQFEDVTVEFRQMHPFPAPAFSNGISALNRADLGYTGRLLILAESAHQHLPVGDASVDPYLVREPDGYMATGDLLRATGDITNSVFPYVLLVDEAKDNREGVSNGGNPEGNYDAPSGGWQQQNAGPKGDGWTGFDYLHGGQTCGNEFTLRRASLEAGGWTLRLAAVIQYTDPRGRGGPDRRFPLDPPDVAEFAYRLPYAALDVSRLTGCADLYVHPAEEAITPVEFWLRDWDASAAEAADADLADEIDVSLIQPGGQGTPQLQLIVPDLLGAPLSLESHGGSGLPGDEFHFTGHLSNPLGADPGIHWGVVATVDPEFGDPARMAYHFGVDADSLAAEAARALNPISVLPLRIEVAPATTGWGRSWGELGEEKASYVAVNAFGETFVGGSLPAGASDLEPGDCRLLVSVPNRQTMAYLSKFDGFGIREWTGIYSGPDSSISVYDLEVDAMGNPLVVFLVGSADVDIDTGPGEVLIGDGGTNLAALAKFQRDGRVVWGLQIPAATPEHDSYDNIFRTVVGGTDGSVYWGGEFSGTRDFDPGPGVTELTSLTIPDPSFESRSDAVVVRFEAGGTFDWVRRWSDGGEESNYIPDLAALPGGGVGGCGSFTQARDNDGGVFDMDPTAGEDLQRANIFGSSAAWQLESDGSYRWGGLWGISTPEPGDEHGSTNTYNVAVDSSGRLYVHGEFSGLMDFDPGPGVDLRNAMFSILPFISSFTADGTYRWMNNYERPASDPTVALWKLWCGPDDNLYMGGTLGDRCDMDWGPGETILEPVYTYSSIAASYDPDGTMRFARQIDSPRPLWTFRSYGSDPNGGFAAVGDFVAGEDLDFGPEIRTLPNGGGIDACFVHHSPDGTW